MKNRLKAAVFFCLYYTGLEWLFARIIRVRAVAILMYHGVCDRAPIPPSINFHLESKLFERQMRALRRRYDVRSVSDVVTALRIGKPLKKGIALTFDDGYRNNAQHVAPLLKRLGMHFTVFVSTQYIGTGLWMPLNQIYWSWAAGNLGLREMRALRQQIRSQRVAESPQLLNSVRISLAPASPKAEESFAMLNWDEIRNMEQAGAEFGSHTHSHCNMAVEDQAQQRRELLVSKELLEQNLSRSIVLFAYPYGKSENISDTSNRNVINAGFECAVSAEYGLVTERSDRFRLPRLGYDRRIWFFTGEILYQFTKQALKDLWSKLPNAAEPSKVSITNGDKATNN
jgi:peptidoglycan/xylan/chitin deacetylase (PgdA/CDA1 family)